MRTRLASLTTVATLLLTALLAACSGKGADPLDFALGAAPAQAAPASGQLDLTGRIMGPQPGPDRQLVELDNPFGQDENVLVDGRRLFVWFNCYGCHGGRAGGGMGPSLRDATWLYGSKDQDIFNSIAEGRPHGMPAWGTKLPVEQMWKLTAYIQSLDTPLEPDAPPPNPVYPNPPPRRDVAGVTAGGGNP